MTDKLNIQFPTATDMYKYANLIEKVPTMSRADINKKNKTKKMKQIQEEFDYEYLRNVVFSSMIDSTMDGHHFTSIEFTNANDENKRESISNTLCEKLMKELAEMGYHVNLSDNNDGMYISWEINDVGSNESATKKTRNSAKKRKVN